MKMSLEKILSKGQQRVPRLLLLRENGRRAESSRYRAAEKCANLEHHVVGVLAIRACTAGPTTPRHYVTSVRHKTRAPAHTSLVLTRTRASESERESECVATSAR